MMVLQTFLIFLVTLWGYSEWFLGTSFIQRPIMLGPLVGLVMGDLQAGITMGATMELAMAGAVSIGAYVPPDMVAGTVLGISLAIQSNASSSAALTLGIPIATLVLAMNTGIGQPLCLWFVHQCDRMAEKANVIGFTVCMLLARYARMLPGLIFIPGAFYFGQDAVASFLENIPDFIKTGMDVAVGILPALGFAMLAQMIMNKKVAPFFFLGFFVVAYGQISVTGVAIFAAILVIIMYLYVNKSGTPTEENSNVVAETPERGDGFDEF